ncbi:Biotin synthase [Phytophthora nicotianae]|uniref:Biotin synthase n=1 Tax=Phytophthora nicotianae TaxID=4792 RepID=A0A0W8DQ23_PHYNI|nr:Biotin synthase [Phytophthora nicotianae]
MSEFRQATAHVDALEARLAQLQQCIADDNANDYLEENFSFILLAMEEDAPLRLQVESKLKQLAQQQVIRQQEEIAREKEARDAQRAAELANEQEKERLLHEAREREAEREREEQERIQALAIAAQKKREQREKERAEEERQRQLEEQERERLNASIPHGKEGLEKAIAMLREGTSNEEPDLSEDLDAWSTWFDELKELQSLVESKLG